MAAVHSSLPEPLTREVAAVLTVAGVEHVAHGDGDPVRAAERAVAAGALALIGPFRSRDVAEASMVTTPAGLPLLAPVATWAGVTRDDEPGCDDPADNRGTIIRLLARDTVVAARVAADVRERGLRALVVAGQHEYGVQLDGQLRLAGLPRAEAGADLVVLCGLAGSPECEGLPPLPVIAFDGVQGAPIDDLLVALPFAPGQTIETPARRAAELVVAAGTDDREQLLARVRSLGPFDASGDPVDPPVWLYRDGRPERAI